MGGMSVELRLPDTRQAVAAYQEKPYGPFIATTFDMLPRRVPDHINRSRANAGRKPKMKNASKRANNRCR